MSHPANWGPYKLDLFRQALRLAGLDEASVVTLTEPEAAAYKWFNFVMRPEIAAMITADAGNFTASKGSDAHVGEALRKQFNASFTPADIDNIKWYPPVPAGLEGMEGKTLDRVMAAKAG